MLEIELSDDLLDGADAIGDFMGWPRRRVYYAASRGGWPIFRDGIKLQARRSTLRRHIEDQERAAVG